MKRLSLNARELIHITAVPLLGMTVAAGIGYGLPVFLWAPVSWVLMGVIYAAPDWTRRRE